MPTSPEGDSSEQRRDRSLGVLFKLTCLLPLVLAGVGCAKLSAQQSPSAVTPPVVGHGGSAGAEAHAVPAAGHAPSAAAARYGVPFAWETSPDEPLARARDFMGEVLSTNARFVALGRPHFSAFVDAQHPRATVVACADSRVQSNAWDETPEDDDFTIRNFGNQVPNALGSVEYGVEHLHTPILLVVGHTGCAAVKAALSKPEGLGAPIQAELLALKLPPPRVGATAAQVWTEAVIANVNAQVAIAAEHFAPFVHSGELTVIGAVYDFRNDLGGEHGRLHLININTNVETARIEAFLKAVQAEPRPAASSRKTASKAASAAEARVQAMIEGIDPRVSATGTRAAKGHAH